MDMAALNRYLSSLSRHRLAIRGFSELRRISQLGYGDRSASICKTKRCGKACRDWQKITAENYSRFPQSAWPHVLVSPEF